MSYILYWKSVVLQIPVVCFDQEVLSGTAFISAIIDHTSVSAHTHTRIFIDYRGRGGVGGGGISSHEKSWGWGHSSHEQSWEGFFIFIPGHAWGDPM